LDSAADGELWDAVLVLLPAVRLVSAASIADSKDSAARLILAIQAARFADGMLLLVVIAMTGIEMP